MHACPAAFGGPGSGWFSALGGGVGWVRTRAGGGVAVMAFLLPIVPAMNFRVNRQCFVGLIKIVVWWIRKVGFDLCGLIVEDMLQMRFLRYRSLADLGPKSYTPNHRYISADIPKRCLLFSERWILTICFSRQHRLG
jgi:hypothetical protein